MELILFGFIFLLVNTGLLVYTKWVEKHLFKYDAMFCRDVRVSIGMFEYASDIEDARKKLNRPNSKF